MPHTNHIADGIPAPNPIYKIPIKNVTGNANEKVQNKNLLNIPNATGRKNNIDYTVANQTITLNGTNASGTYSWIIITKDSFIFNNGTPSANQIVNWANGELLAIGQVVKSVQILSGSSTRSSFSLNLYDENGNLISTFTETTKVSAWGIYLGSSDTYTNFKFGLQLEQGSTATSYVPHQEQNYPFTFAEGQRAMQGTTLEDDGIHQKRKHYRYTGNETFEKSSYTDSTSFVCFSLFNDLKINANAGYCNVGVVKNIVEVRNYINGFFYHQDLRRGYLKIQKSAIPNWDDNLTDSQQIDLLKTFLSQRYANNNAVEVEYDLAESKLENNIIPYNSTQQAQYNAIKQARSYDDITYITSTSNELGFNMDVESLANANKVIDSLDTRLLALESEV